MVRAERGLLRRFGQDCIASSERRRDLSGVDGEREVPRTDAKKDAAPLELDGVGFAGGTWQRGRRGKQTPALGGVESQQIDGLPHLGVRGWYGLAGFRDGQRNELGVLRLECVRATFERSCAVVCRGRVPRRPCCMRAVERA